MSGEGGIRTHVPPNGGNLISSQARYNHFGTSPVKDAEELYNKDVEKKHLSTRIRIWIRCRIFRIHNVDLREFGPWMQVYCVDCQRVIHAYIPGA